MSVLAPTPVPGYVDRAAPGLGRRIAERRRLARHDRITACLAELHSARALLADAATVVEAGWIQDGWFAYRDEQGRQRLVGAIVHAGGGLAAARSEPVQHALDLTWQALFRGTDPVGYCPSPASRTVRVRELSRWNDRPSRTAGEVLALLGVADRVAASRVDQARSVVCDVQS
jgi:hypothetical protein